MKDEKDILEEAEKFDEEFNDFIKKFEGTFNPAVMVYILLSKTFYITFKTAPNDLEAILLINDCFKNVLEKIKEEEK